MLSERLERVASGVNLPECPRWRDGRLWFIDMYGNAIWQWEPSKGASVALETDDDPGGLGWLPDGSLLFVQMRTRRLMRLTESGPVLHADLSVVHGTYLNDMVVDHSGRAYVDSTTRRDLGDSGPDHIVIVEPDGALRIGTDQIESSNGLAISTDGRTLITSQPPLHQISAATILESGDLTDIRVWNRADENVRPDGLCLDEEGAVWFGGVTSESCIRMLPDGTITHEIRVGRRVFACMLGGEDRRQLFVLSADTTTEEIRSRSFRRQGVVEVVEVDVPGAGLP